ncbi:MAG TPA: beta-ketoacyl-[acyl-carrier-protein] synthase II, partial [Rhodanobacter sp.]|nr:beta-ketoacyl-[acyl-carrier-protein] synthase II [Rhodanobacter sp.]
MTAYLNALGVICSLGYGKQEVAAALFAGDANGIRTEAGWAPGRSLPLGAVNHELPPMPPALTATRDNRANRLLLAAALEIESDIRAAIRRHGEHRVGVVIGTSTTGIERTTEAI